MIRPARRAKL